MGKLSNVGRVLLMGLISIYCAACDLVSQHTQTQETKDFVISLTNDPHPIRAGEPVKLYATLRRDRTGASGCSVRFLPTRAEIDDAEVQWVEMLERSRSGVYDVTYTFPAKGIWRTEFEVNCIGVPRTLVFEHSVE